MNSPINTPAVRTPAEVKSQIEIAKLERRLRKERRAERFDAANEWVAWGVTKIAGVAAFSVGVMEMLLPQLLSIDLGSHAPTAAGVGFTILAGKAALKAVRDTSAALVDKIE